MFSILTEQWGCTAIDMCQGYRCPAVDTWFAPRGDSHASVCHGREQISLNIHKDRSNHLIKSLIDIKYCIFSFVPAGVELDLLKCRGYDGIKSRSDDLPTDTRDKLSINMTDLLVQSSSLLSLNPCDIPSPLLTVSEGNRFPLPANIIPQRLQLANIPRHARHSIILFETTHPISKDVFLSKETERSPFLLHRHPRYSHNHNERSARLQNQKRPRLSLRNHRSDTELGRRCGCFCPLNCRRRTPFLYKSHVHFSGRSYGAFGRRVHEQRGECDCCFEIRCCESWGLFADLCVWDCVFG